MCSDESQPIVVDLGTQNLRVGLAGDDLPRCIFPSVLGIARGTDGHFLPVQPGSLFPLDPLEKRDNVDVRRALIYDVSASPILTSTAGSTPTTTSSSNLPPTPPTSRGRGVSRSGSSSPRNGSCVNKPFSSSTSNSGSNSPSGTSNGISSRSRRSRYVLDAEITEKLLEEACGSGRGLEESLADRPVVLSEPNLLDKDYRWRMAELLFEGLGVTSAFLGKKAALAAFACGRTTGLVLDIGASSSCVCTLQEGFVIPRAVVEYPVGGDFLDQLILLEMRCQQNQIIPPFAISVAAAASSSQSAVSTYSSSSFSSSASSTTSSSSGSSSNSGHSPTTADKTRVEILATCHVCSSYLFWGKQNVAASLKFSSCFCPEVAGENGGGEGEGGKCRKDVNSEERGGGVRGGSSRSTCGDAESRQIATYTLPDGSTVEGGVINELVPHVLFSPLSLTSYLSTLLQNPVPAGTGSGPGGSSSSLPSSSCPPSLSSVLSLTSSSVSAQTLSDCVRGYPGVAQMLYESAVDSGLPNSRDVLASIVITGGSTLFPNFLSFLNYQLIEQKTFASFEEPWRLLASPRPRERQSAAWIGGSILGSLGSFWQHSMTKQEYMEMGVGVVDRKFP